MYMNVYELPTIRLAMKSWQFDLWRNSKLEKVKTISTARIINAILLNIKINQPKLAIRVHTNWQQICKITLKYKV